MRMHASKERHDVRKPSSTCRRSRSTGRKLNLTSTPSWQWRGIGSTTARSKVSSALTSDSVDNSQQPERMRRIGVLMGFAKRDSEAQAYIAALPGRTPEARQDRG